MKKLIISAIILLNTGFLSATPEFSLWTGNSCSSCHVNPQGGGMRKEFGWSFAKDASFLNPSQAGMEGLYNLDKSKYRKFDSLFSYGMDFRLQSFRSHKTPEAKRKYIPMQASLYANLKPLKWLSFDGQYNLGNLIKGTTNFLQNVSDGEDVSLDNFVNTVKNEKLIFNGQTYWSASALIQPAKWLPSLRLGRFMPAMGLRDCDMTMLDRRVATPNGSETFIPPDYSEYGVELNYNYEDWLHVNAGAFDSENLKETADQQFFGFQFFPYDHNPSFTLRFVLFPEMLIEGFPAMYFGASTLVNGDLLYNNAFIGAGVTDNIHLYAKYAYTNKHHVRLTNALILGASYIPLKGVVLGARAEHGQSDWYLDLGAYKTTFKTSQYVLNAKIFVLPYIELIPEYRYVVADEYKSMRWAVQLHLFY